MIDLFWWRPFSSARDVLISTAKYGSAWLRLYSRTRSVRNFGDELSPLVLSLLTGERVRYASFDRASHICVGSILNSALAGSFAGTVVGSGLRRPIDVDGDRVERMSIVGVRGVLSARQLGVPSDRAIGDPGLLVGEVFSFPANERRTGPRVLIPHFGDFRSRRNVAVMRSLASGGWRVVPPTAPVRDVALAVYRAPYVASSSLHGYIFAHSYGTAADLLAFEPAATEPGFKYQDYCSVLGIEPRRVGVEELSARSTDALVAGTAENTEAVGKRLGRVLSHMEHVVKGSGA